MATMTAQILVGQKHSYDGGIINMSHVLYLSENDRPAWILTPMDLFNDHKQAVGKRVTWIPTLENMLEDALVMIGMYVLKDEKLLDMANKYFQDATKDYMELYQDIEHEHCEELYKHIRTIESAHKIIVSVFRGSSIVNQLAILEDFKNDIEVCNSIYGKEFSLWRRQFETYGSLV